MLLKSFSLRLSCRVVLLHTQKVLRWSNVSVSGASSRADRSWRRQSNPRGINGQRFFVVLATRQLATMTPRARAYCATACSTKKLVRCRVRSCQSLSPFQLLLQSLALGSSSDPSHSDHQREGNSPTRTVAYTIMLPTMQAAFCIARWHK